ncbi:MAG: ABC transporter permease subunit [Cyanobacteria bacterium RI_101]|nr:ABC transporter permease subunit [Cyanobacteria bacterium RI_101]
MGRYLPQRLVIALATLLGVSLTIFLLLALAPGDPLGELATNPSLSDAARENLRRSFGLDQPLPIRYAKWLSAALRGDFGYSFTSRAPVLDLLRQRLPATLWLVGSAYTLSAALMIPLGVWSASRLHSFGDKLVNALGLLGYSLPTFLTGLMVILIFSVGLRWFPFIYDSGLDLRDWHNWGAQIRQLVLPVAVLVFYQGAALLRFTRSAVREELPQDYIRTAYAKGLSPGRVIWAHLARNALLPLVTLVSLDLPALFTGALVTEQIFRVPGMGALMVESIYRSDTPVVMAITCIYGFLIVVFSTLADLLYAWLDPRIRY